MKRKKNLNCSTPFPDTGKMALSYQLGRGYWDFGDLSAQRGVYDSPKRTVVLRIPVDYLFIFFLLMCANYRRGPLRRLLASPTTSEYTVYNLVGKIEGGLSDKSEVYGKNFLNYSCSRRIIHGLIHTDAFLGQLQP